MDPKSRELFLRLFTEALYWRMAYEEAEPDVGIGPFPDSELSSLAKTLKVQLEPDSHKEILKRYRRKRGRNG